MNCRFDELESQKRNFWHVAWTRRGGFCPLMNLAMDERRSLQDKKKEAQNFQLAQTPWDLWNKDIELCSSLIYDNVSLKQWFKAESYINLIPRCYNTTKKSCDTFFLLRKKMVNFLWADSRNSALSMRNCFVSLLLGVVLEKLRPTLKISVS